MKIFLVEIYVVFSKLPYFSFTGLLQNLQKSLTLSTLGFRPGLSVF